MNAIALQNKPIEITLFDLRVDLIAAWSMLLEKNRELSMVRPYHGDFADVLCQAIVSPGNGFGFMDGGIDRVYTDYFGKGVQDALQEKIRRKFDGELLVGQATIIATNDRQIPYLIAAPTMSVPMRLEGVMQANPYYAMRAVMQLLLKGRFDDGPMKGRLIRSVVESIAVPGFGTGVGGISASVCAHQQIKAIREALIAPAAFPATWQDAQEQLQRLYTDRPFDLQQD